MLISCPECGAQISDSAPTCPKCGVVLTKCPDCGAISAGTPMSCPKCGAPLANQQANIPNAPISQTFPASAQQPFAGQHLRPDNHLTLAIITTILCCLPLGIVSIVKANKVNSLFEAGQYEMAELTANEAQNWSIAGIVITIIGYIIYGILLGIGAISL